MGNTINRLFFMDDFRWPVSIYMLVGDVSSIAFFGRNDLTDFNEFWHP